MEAVILARAEEISHIGQSLGLFEFALWAVQNRVRLQVIVGSCIVDVISVCGGELDNPDLKSAPRKYVVACRCVGGHLRPGSLGDHNHWVVAEPLQNHEDHGPVPAGDSISLHEQLLSMGFGCVETQVIILEFNVGMRQTWVKVQYCSAV